MRVSVMISVAELFDKITILEIKLDLLQDYQKSNVQKEYDILQETTKDITVDTELENLISQLKEVNQKLFDSIEETKIAEESQIFDVAYIQSARNVYKYNAQRSEIKKQINLKTQSEIIEEKSWHEN